MHRRMPPTSSWKASRCIKPSGGIPITSIMYRRLVTSCHWNCEPSKWGVFARFIPGALCRAIVTLLVSA